MKNIEIKINGELRKNERDSLIESGLTIIEKKSLFGGEHELTIIGSIAISSVAAISRIIIEIIKNKAKIEIEINGNKIKNISEKTLAKLLKENIKDNE